MTPESYLDTQLHNIDDAIRCAEKTLDAVKSLQRRFGKNKPHKEGNSFLEDSFRYFDSNGALGQIEGVQLKIRNLKNKLIEIKVANDQMLLEGGFLKSIDTQITEVFLSNRLCKRQSLDVETVTALEDVIRILNSLKTELTQG